MIFGYDITEKP